MTQAQKLSSWTFTYKNYRVSVIWRSGKCMIMPLTEPTPVYAFTIEPDMPVLAFMQQVDDCLRINFGEENETE